MPPTNSQPHTTLDQRSAGHRIALLRLSLVLLLASARCPSPMLTVAAHQYFCQHLDFETV